jgi:hypothetical protein
MGSVSKAVKRIIPKEIQPILPIAASMFGGPLVGSALGGIGSLAARPVLTQALASGLTSAGVDFLTSGKVDPKTLVTSTLLGAGGQYFKDVGAGNKGIMGLDLSKKAQEEFGKLGDLIAPTGIDKSGKFDISGDIVKSGATAATAGGSIAAYNAAEQAQRDYDEMMAGKEADAAADRQARIDFITQNMQLAGFSQEEIDDALRNAGFQNGGRVGFQNGGDVGTLGDSMQEIKILLMKNEILSAGGGGFGGKDLDNKTDDEIIEIHEGLFGQGKAKGGLMATRVGFRNGGTDYSPTIPYGGRTGEFFLNAMKEAKNEKDARPGYGEEERFRTVGEIIDPNSVLKYLFPFDEFPKSRKEIKRELEEVMEDSEKKDDNEMMARDDRIGDLFNLLEAERMAGDDADLDLIKEYEAELFNLMGSRKTAAEGGIMNLKMGGMPAEMDLRGGGFVPIGAKEKADDVPARLSKNEFVMTADAVRAAGGGSVNKGAKKMYDLMNKLEARV